MIYLIKMRVWYLLKLDRDIHGYRSFVICFKPFGFLFKNKFLADKWSFFRASGNPSFGFLVMFSLGFKASLGSALFTFCRGECNVHSMRSTSAATHADLLASVTQMVTSPYACAQVGLGSDLNRQSPGQKTNALPLCRQPSLYSF